MFRAKEDEQVLASKEKEKAGAAVSVRGLVSPVQASQYNERKEKPPGGGFDPTDAPLVKIDFGSKTAVYMQIEDQIRFAVASGRLKPRDELPSVNDLSKHIRVKYHTVRTAYRDLEITGIIQIFGRVGVYVREGADTRCRDDYRQHIIELMREAAAGARAVGMSLQEFEKVCIRSYPSDPASHEDSASKYIRQRGAGSR